MADPTFESLIPKSSPDLESLKLLAHKAGYDLLVELNRRAGKDKWLQICTSESLTAGLVMATLVDIPWAGYLKYGCFGVYDTDAKRVFNHVMVDDVYTHRCAKEMAVGILRNSNATIAIAVTGNAMPLNEHVDMVGEVFIGVAGYNSNGEIIYTTKSINACLETEEKGLKELCASWYTTIARNRAYNPRDKTALMSQEIRNYTTYAAFKHCLDFVTKHNPVVPDAVWNRKKMNDIKATGNDHLQIPANKFEDSMQERCIDLACVNIKSEKRLNTKPFFLNMRGGTRRRRSSKVRTCT